MPASFPCPLPLWVHLLCPLLLAAGPAPAGLDIDQYLPPVQAVFTDEERERREALVRQQIEQARLRAEQRARQELDAESRRVAALAARPYPVRLTESRCLGCHGLDTLAERPRTRLGWELVALRMQRFNGAYLEAGERGVIAAHLARTYPAPRWRRTTEFLALVAALLAPLLAWWLWQRPRRSPSH